MRFEDEMIALLPRLRRFAHALARDAADADDLCQAAVERALKARAQWQPGPRLESWMYRIMRNLWIDTGRARTRHKRMKVKVTYRNQDNPSRTKASKGSNVSQEELDAILDKISQKGMESLTDKERQILKQYSRTKH